MNIKHPIVIGFFLILTISASPPAMSWWNLWSDKKEESDSSPVILAKTRQIRMNDCGSAHANRSFGETSYMREELPSNQFTDKQRAILAAATISESKAETLSLLKPLLQHKQPHLRAVGLITFIFWELKHRKVSEKNYSKILKLLNSPVLNNIADKHYLLATIGYQQNNWKIVSNEAKKAVEIAPLYYNAQVLYALDSLRKLSLTPISCLKSMRKTQEILFPVLSQGACPTHVAHFDLAVERYLPVNNSDVAKRNNILRKITLSYVAKNSSECKRQLEIFTFSKFKQSCATVIQSVKCD